MTRVLAFLSWLSVIALQWLYSLEVLERTNKTWLEFAAFVLLGLTFTIAASAVNPPHRSRGEHE